MVVRLEGKVDGKDVIFSRVSEELWETTIPLDVDGMYIVELTAYDEYGNFSYVTKILLTFHPENRCVKIELFPWKTFLEKSELENQVYFSNFYAVLLEQKFVGGEHFEDGNGLWRITSCENTNCQY